MKTVLCYGDSNTWGAIPVKQDTLVKKPVGRYDWQTRWPGVLQSELGESWRVVENGLNGRTTVFDDRITNGRNGWKSVQTILESSLPLDLFILMLGTNDCKTAFSANAWDIGTGAEVIIDTVKKVSAANGMKVPEILLISPIHLTDLKNGEGFGVYFDEKGLEVSKELGDVFQIIAKRNAVHFLDAADYAKTGADDLHLDEKGHRELGYAVARKIAEIFD